MNFSAIDHYLMNEGKELADEIFNRNLEIDIVRPEFVLDWEWVRNFFFQTCGGKASNQSLQAEVIKAVPTSEVYSPITYLEVPYEEKDKAKALGAKWNKEKKKWYCIGNTEKFTLWLGQNKSISHRNQIADSYSVGQKKSTTLEKYLRSRGVGSVNALTFKEAKLLGIKWPLQNGWASRHSGMVISQSLEDKLIAARRSSKYRRSQGLNA
jgi:hypothetical protein